MKNQRISRMLWLLAFVIAASSGRAQGQYLVLCDTSALDGGFCNGCEYYQNPDGTCSGGGTDGGSGCPTTNSNVYMTSYNDQTIDGNGNLEAWATTSNSDGNAGEGVLSASVNVILPDGSSPPPSSMSDSNSSNVTASFSTSGIDFSSMTDNGSGQISYSNEINWDCGVSSFGSIRGRVGISRRTFQFAGISGGTCTYTLDCPSGQSPTCSTNVFYKAPPCYETYINDASLYVVYGSTLSCFGVGNAPGSYTQGVCD